MGLFSRRSKQPALVGSPGAPVMARAPEADEATFGPTGWLAFAPVATPNVQIGAFRDRLLNQYPAYWPGIQRENGRTSNNPNWVVLRTYEELPNQASQYPANAAQTQRYGSIYGGPLGPISAQLLADRVAAGQVRQSGSVAVNYALALQGR